MSDELWQVVRIFDLSFPKDRPFVESPNMHFKSFFFRRRNLSQKVSIHFMGNKTVFRCETKIDCGISIADKRHNWQHISRFTADNHGSFDDWLAFIPSVRITHCGSYTLSDDIEIDTPNLNVCIVCANVLLSGFELFFFTVDLTEHM